MKRIVKAFVPATVLVLTFLLSPAQGAVPKTVLWVCDVPGEGLVTFVSAPSAAARGIMQANAHAGQVFHDQFGEVCTVVLAG